MELNAINAARAHMGVTAGCSLARVVRILAATVPQGSGDNSALRTVSTATITARSGSTAWGPPS